MDNERLEKIRAYGNAKVMEKKREEDRIRAENQELKGRIRKLKGRIDTLVTLVNACTENGIKWYGTSSDDYLRWKNGSIKRNGGFRANGWSHLVGFIWQFSDEVKYIGMEGLGADCDEDFYTDGKEIHFVNMRNYAISTESENSYMQKFLDGFDEFERLFLEFIDSYTSQEVTE